VVVTSMPNSARKPPACPVEAHGGCYIKTQRRAGMPPAWRLCCAKTPTGRLGILPSSLFERRAAIFQIPQPEGWGYFIPAYGAGTQRGVANGPSRFVSASVNPSLQFARLREETDERVRM
jgi:hypothetical protein